MIGNLKKYICAMSYVYDLFSSQVRPICCPNTHADGQIALPGPLKWSVEIWSW